MKAKLKSQPRDFSTFIKNNSLNILFLLLSFTLISTWVISPFLIPKIFKGLDATKFGDIFNSISSLFSGLAFLGVIYTVVLQRQELKLQREELVLTRQELHRSAKAQEESGEALSMQVRNSAITAKINGLTTILSYYQSQEINTSDPKSVIDKRERIDNKINEIQQEISNLISY